MRCIGENGMRISQVATSCSGEPGLSSTISVTAFARLCRLMDEIPYFVHFRHNVKNFQYSFAVTKSSMVVSSDTALDK